MKTVFRLIAFGLVISLWAGVPVWAQSAEKPKTKEETNREVALTYAQIYLEQKLYDEAETILLDSLKTDGEDGAILNFLGLVQLQDKHFAQASHSFQTAARVFKEKQDRIYALYNLANAYYQGGRVADAIQVLNELKKIELEISDSAEKTLELIEAGAIPPGSPLPEYRKHARGKFRFSGAISGGFDSNVLLIEENISTGIPVKSRGSFYFTPTVHFGYLGKTMGQLLDVRLVNAFTSYTTSTAQSFNNLYNKLDVFFGTNTSRWGFFGDLIFLNNRSFGVYNYDLGILWQQKKRTTSNEIWTIETPLRFQKFVLSPLVVSSNDRTGGGAQLKINYLKQFNDLEFLSLSGIMDHQYTLGKNYRLSGLWLPFSMGIQVPGFKEFGLINTVNAELSGQLYWQNDFKRKDFSYRIGTGLTTTLFETWNLSLDYYFYKNLSNVSAATYSKGVTSFLLSHHFL